VSEPKALRGRYFEHRQFIDARGLFADRIPQLMKVTRVAKGSVYYRIAEVLADGEVSLGGGHYTNLEDFEAKRVLRWTTPIEHWRAHFSKEPPQSNFFDDRSVVVPLDLDAEMAPRAARKSEEK